MRYEESSDNEQTLTVGPRQVNGCHLALWGYRFVDTFFVCIR